MLTVFAAFKRALGARRWLDVEEGELDNRLFDTYHSEVDQTSQELVPQIFSRPESGLRCLISTIAFGMGMNIPNIKYVIHWGPSKDILSYWQEVGRCCRDGSDGKAIMYVPSYSMSSRFVDPAMIAFVKEAGTLCLRSKVLKTLKIEGMEDRLIDECCGGNRCCDFCNGC